LFDRQCGLLFDSHQFLASLARTNVGLFQRRIDVLVRKLSLGSLVLAGVVALTFNGQRHPFPNQSIAGEVVTITKAHWPTDTEDPATVAAASCGSPVGAYSACEGICGCGTVTQGPEVSTNSVTNECGQTTSAIISGNTVTAWEMHATLSADGTQLIWPNGSIWVRTCTQCGDGIVQTGEECDDGNTKDSDGCSAGCRCESVGSGEIELKIRPPHVWTTDGTVLGGPVVSGVGEVIQVVYRRGFMPNLAEDHYEYQYFKRAGVAPIEIGRCRFFGGRNQAFYDGPKNGSKEGVLYFTSVRWVTVEAVCDNGSPPNGKVDKLEYTYVPCRAEKTTVHKQGDYPSECKTDILGQRCFGGKCKLDAVVFTRVNTFIEFVCPLP
jgi:cysteine-rich repeat protein